MRSAEWTARASSPATDTTDRTIPVNSAFRIPHSALARWRSVAGLPLVCLLVRRPHAARHLFPAWQRSAHVARAPFRAAAPGRGRALARHGVAGGVRPRALGAGESTGGRLVRGSRDDLRARGGRLAARAVPPLLGGGDRSPRPRAGRSLLRRL